MNYLIAFAVCMLFTILEANDDNYRRLLFSDGNVAFFLALAWVLDRGAS